MACSQVFGEWNGAELESFLIEITRDILKFHDTDGSSLVDKILDTAGQVMQYLCPELRILYFL